MPGRENPFRLRRPSTTAARTKRSLEYRVNEWVRVAEEYRCQRRGNRQPLRAGVGEVVDGAERYGRIVGPQLLTVLVGFFIISVSLCRRHVFSVPRV